MPMSFKDEVYKVVKAIPEGKIITYKAERAI
jgi:alkylated DNA nucleotide flippase Atl1